MAIRCEIEGRVLRVIAEGEYRLSDVQSALDAAIASPEFEAPMCVLADARASQAKPLTAEVRDTATYLASIRDQFLPLWVLVVHGSLRYGLARMLSAFAEIDGIELRVHRDFCEGERVAREATA